MKSDIKKKKQASNTIITQAYHSDAAPESCQVRREWIETFNPSYASSKVKSILRFRGLGIIIIIIIIIIITFIYNAQIQLYSFQMRLTIKNYTNE